MHELSLVENALELVKTTLADYQVKRINSITFQIGRMANVIPAALEFAFEASTQVGYFQGAEMIIENIPITVQCQQCGQNYQVDTVPFICPGCHGNNGAILGGADVIVADVDFDEED